MADSKGRSCVLVGSDSLLVQCGETLLARGYDLRAVATDEPRVAQWARETGIEVREIAADAKASDASWAEGLEAFDLLFSITWLKLLPAEVLALPRQLAVNFHDGPLPRYAGLNAPAWAILNGEQNFGVSWHEMKPEVDSGDVLASRSFQPEADETALSINARCFEAGLEAFGDLLDGLESGNLQRTAQDRTQRSVFTRSQRPEAACAIDWNGEAKAAEALCRALDHGPYPNPLGLPKIFREGKALGVLRAQACDGQSGAEPGTVLGADGDGITVACADGGALRLEAFTHFCGAELTAEQAARFLGLAGAGQLGALDNLNGVQRDLLSRRNAKVARAEGFYVRRLEGFEPTEAPLASLRAEGSNERRTATLSNVPANLASDADALAAAFCAWLSRVASSNPLHFSLGLVSGAAEEGMAELGSLEAVRVPAQVAVDPATDRIGDVQLRVTREFKDLRDRGAFLRDLVARRPKLSGRSEIGAGRFAPVAIDFRKSDEAPTGVDATLILALFEGATAPRLEADGLAYAQEDLARLTAGFETFLASVASRPESLIADHELLPAEERAQVLTTWNATEQKYRDDATVHGLFAEQVARTPDRTAAISGENHLTYAELDVRANRLANRLVQLGVRPGSMVGVCLDRSNELLIAVLAAMKASGAYLPLDPEFPAERIAFMLEDAEAPVVITTAHLAADLRTGKAAVVRIDDDAQTIAAAGDSEPETQATPSDLAYVIYTSGSTGKPKGVMVEHRNAANFFAGMDERIGVEVGQSTAPGNWLAVTSLSFDISVLELLWTATRGFTTVIYGGVKRATESQTIPGVAGAHPGEIGFSLSFFASNAGENAAEQYRFLLEAARFADEHDFEAIWTPERHFHAFGGLYPNPSVTSAALAAATKRLALRCGSVVVALHHPIRIAEEWSLVDNLSGGRVGISIASGWHPNDFVLAPDRYERRKEIMIEDTAKVRTLWRGEAVEFKGPKGDMVATKLMPKPVQKELPIWITAAGNPETFRQAGEIGASILTHLLGQSPEELAKKLEIYRQARRDAGIQSKGHVTIMLHTFIGEDVDEVREIVRGPMREYLRSAADLIKNHVDSWSAVKTSVDGGSAPKIGSLEEVPAEDMEALLDWSFERYFETSALFGTPESCMEMVDQLHGLGVDEITCLVDFGVPSAQVAESLPRLDALRRKAAERYPALAAPSHSSHSKAGDEPLEVLCAKHEITHLQCTPSMAAMLSADPACEAALGKLTAMMVGGEPFPLELARDLRKKVTGKLLNMYGPTETTIWSSTASIGAPVENVTIGTPIANTQMYVLDERLRPVPVGVHGHLWIGGAGVTRGYHGRPELTAERFVSNPFRPGTRIYQTGDVVRWLPSGELEFGGRADHQVKVRGYRIELGEIESRLAEHAGVAQAVCVPRAGGDPSDVRLCAWLIAAPGSPELDDAKLREHLSANLPDYMIPSDFAYTTDYPLTPNAKVDRKELSTRSPRKKPSVQATTAAPKPALPAPDSGSADSDGTSVNDAIAAVRGIWSDVLGVEDFGLEENFFDLGGHSLLTIRVQKALRENHGAELPLVDLFRFTTVQALAERVAGGSQPSSPAASESKSGGKSRAQMRAERRRRSTT